ncbi:MAG: Beta-galactosidase C-terminal domain, partial [Ktedonobacteraceae bacterium]|nr:Beta-galactosidase C-terminal domain [Ktedonobacteraceae bacterium]
ALTAHQFGQGCAYYLATQGSEVLLAGLLRQLCLEASISSLLEAPEGVEVTMRVRADGRPVYFLLNHTDGSTQVTLPAGTFTSLLDGQEISGQVELAARDVAVLLG